jgi:Transposase DDE domain
MKGKSHFVLKAEDERYGKGGRGDELPEELKFKQSRLAKIKEAKEARAREARQEAESKRLEQEKKSEEGSDRRGRPPKAPSDKPDGNAQRNFTDSDSRIMKESATKSLAQCYNAQAAVDGSSQVIVATRVSQQANDKRELKPLIEKLKINLDGARPKKISADNGYLSEENLIYLAKEEIDAYVSAGRLKHTDRPLPAPRGRIPKDATIKERMARKLRTIKGRMIYAKRKEISEPVFGQIKEVRRFRQFLLRGIASGLDGSAAALCPPLSITAYSLIRGHPDSPSGTSAPNDSSFQRTTAGPEKSSRYADRLLGK